MEITKSFAIEIIGIRKQLPKVMELKIQLQCQCMTIESMDSIDEMKRTMEEMLAIMIKANKRVHLLDDIIREFMEQNEIEVTKNDEYTVDDFPEFYEEDDDWASLVYDDPPPQVVTHSQNTFSSEDDDALRARLQNLKNR